MTKPRLQLTRITKAFGTLVANDAIDLAIRPGEIHALLGENGAGKSTLVKIIYGVLQPDGGTVQWEGRETAILSPQVARDLGIGMVFQHFTLFEALSVLENVALGIETRESRAALAGRVRAVSRAYGLPLEPDRPVHTLAVGERQRIEIVRSLLQDPQLLIMDEPTSVLTPQEVELLFATLRRLAEEGCSILYISHKLEEVRALCERATILRRGRVVAEVDPRAETARSLAALMVGGQLEAPRQRTPQPPGPPRLEVSGLSLDPPAAHGVPLHSISLTVCAGEILGIAGVAGNGQDLLLAAVSGEITAPAATAIRIDGRPAGHLSPAERRALGLAYVPEERNGHGMVGSMPLVENTLLSGWRRLGLAPRGILARAKAAGITAGIVDRYDVRTSGIEAPAATLSGGNLQKFMVGREIAQAPTLLVVAQPTWGVDAGAAAAIHRALLDLGQSGCAILLVSQDLDEVLALADRIAVINAGRLSPELNAADASIERIGLLMGGLHDLEAAAAAA
jgi:ABC-type uncharacterized transport system ATPase subunit